MPPQNFQAAPRSPRPAAVRRPEFFVQLDRFWQRVTEGLALSQLWKQFSADARASYRLYHRDFQARSPQDARKPGFWNTAQEYAWAILEKLTPARRVLLLVGLVLLILPSGGYSYHGKTGEIQVVDSMVNDGLWDIYNDYHMGITGENVAEKYGITREEQDEFAVNSHRKAVAAIKECRFKGQIVPVEIPAKKKGAPPTIFDKDESPREDTTIEVLRALKPAFKKDGTVTAGNAPGVNDGAAALVVTSAARAKELGAKPMVRIIAQATSGVEPKWVMMAPVGAVQQIWQKTGWKNEDVDLYELNEAFSVQALGVMRELKLNPEKVNVNGGAVAIGHPIGASGARILTTLIYEMIRRDVKRGIAALCLGGGNAVAMAVER